MVVAEIPRPVRIATILAWALAPAGLLLIAVAVLELRWWAGADATRLTGMMAQIRTDLGVAPPALLRGRPGAIQLLVLGLVCLAYAVLAPMIGRGRLRARNWALGLGIVTFLVGLFFVGGDATEPRDLRSYFSTLTDSAQGDRVPALRALVYPAWYQWAEDIAQGLQLLLSLAVVLALFAAMIWHAEHFVRRGRRDDVPDEWDAALDRIRGQAKDRDDA